MANDDSDPVSFGPNVPREYALVADGERGGLIGPHGELTWMCGGGGQGRPRPVAHGRGELLTLGRPTP